MKEIDFDLIQSSDPKLQAMLRKLLKGQLSFSASRRFQNTESVMFEIYRILKRYNIRYTRYAIKKFLMDAGLSKVEPLKVQQDIYIGQV